MSTPDAGDPDAREQRRVPRNRFRALFIGTFLLILVVIFGYMLLVGNIG
jgi:hypothetical protein